MQQLYASRLEITGEDLQSSYEGVVEEVVDWAWRGDGDAPELLAEPFGEMESEEYAIAWQNLVVRGHDEVATQVQLRHSDQEHSGLQWVSAVDVVRGPRRIDTTIRVARVATELRIAPARVDLRRPRLVPALIQHYACTAGDGIPCSTLAHEIQPGDVEAFVRDVLTAPTRRLPVIVLCPAAGAERPEANPDVVADTLAGLGHVYVLAGQLTWERVRDTLGNGRFVPRGGARLYWPGFREPA